MTATEQIITLAAFAVIAASLLALLRDYLQHKQHTEFLTRCVSEHLDVPILSYTSSQGFKLAKAHPTDTCFDLYAAEDHVITKRRSIIKTGIRLELPDGYCAEVRPRSGASAKGIPGRLVKMGKATEKLIYGDVIFGTIDQGYTGEIRVIFRSDLTSINPEIAKYVIPKGTRIAQLCITKRTDIYVSEAKEISDSTERDSDGFGSTGYGEYKKRLNYDRER